MKNLTDCINESLLTASIAALILPVLCLAETFYNSLKTEEDEKAKADHSLKGLVSNNGLVTGFIEWVVDKFEDFQVLLQDKRVRKEMNEIEESDEFKEYLKLPKKERTLKKLREIGNNANLKDSRAVIQIWDEFKKSEHVSDKDLLDEI